MKHDNMNEHIKDDSRTPSAVLLDRILDEGIKAHADVIAPIIARRRIAVVAFEPRSKMSFDHLRDLGWDGEAPAFEMTSGARKRFARAMAAAGDPVTSRWLESSRAGRIYVCTGEGTLLINHRFGEGYMLEPGSTDREYLS